MAACPVVVLLYLVGCSGLVVPLRLLVVVLQSLTGGLFSSIRHWGVPAAGAVAVACQLWCCCLYTLLGCLTQMHRLSEQRPLPTHSLPLSSVFVVVTETSNAALTTLLFIIHNAPTLALTGHPFPPLTPQSATLD